MAAQQRLRCFWMEQTREEMGGVFLCWTSNSSLPSISSPCLDRPMRLSATGLRCGTILMRYRTHASPGAICLLTINSSSRPQPGDAPWRDHTDDCFRSPEGRLGHLGNDQVFCPMSSFCCFLKVLHQDGFLTLIQLLKAKPLWLQILYLIHIGDIDSRREVMTHSGFHLWSCRLKKRKLFRPLKYLLVLLLSSYAKLLPLICCYYWAIKPGFCKYNVIHALFPSQQNDINDHLTDFSITLRLQSSFSVWCSVY